MTYSDTVVSHLNNADQTARGGGNASPRIGQARELATAIARELADAWIQADRTDTDPESALDKLGEAVATAVVQLVGTRPKAP